MKIYKCNHCSKEFKRSDYLKKHLNRKFPCINNGYKMDTKWIQNNPKIIPKSSQKFPKKSKKNPKNPVLENEKKYFCKFCGKNYKTKMDYINILKI